MSLELFDLTGTLALITGSGQGIGFILAKGLVQAGSTVILNDIDKERLDNAVALLKKEGLKVYGVVFDVRNEKEIGEQIQFVKDEIGSINILVNNVGIQIRAPLEKFSSSDWQRILDVNLTGSFLTSKAVVQGMIRNRVGKIINICSIQSELARPTIVLSLKIWTVG